MCVTSAPAQLSRTILLATEANLGGEVVHVLGYQNTVQNLAVETSPNLTWSQIAGLDTPPVVGNAMILPFPAQAGSMTRENVVSTEGSPKFLEEMAKLLQPRTRGSLLSFGATRGGANSVEIFDHGIYTVVLASQAGAIADALEAVPSKKRPKIGTDFFDAYDRLYAGWTIALCCFNNADAKRASPLLWWYKPMYPEVLFAPGLDAHDGRPPNVKEEVAVDHTVIFGSHLAQAGLDVYWSRRPDSDVEKLLPRRIVGKPVHGRLSNGDFVARVKDVREGSFDFNRLPPPGAA